MPTTTHFHDELLKALADKSNKIIFDKSVRLGFTNLTYAYGMYVKELEKKQMQQKTRTFIASPYRGDIERNQAYLIECMQDSIDKGEAPFAPHMMYTQVLDDDNESEREAGIDCGIAFMGVCDKMAVYIDNGVSEGMHHEIKKAYELGLDVEFRNIEKSRFTGKDVTFEIDGAEVEGLNSINMDQCTIHDEMSEGEPIILPEKRYKIDLEVKSLKRLVNQRDGYSLYVEPSNERVTLPENMLGLARDWFFKRDLWHHGGREAFKIKELKPLDDGQFELVFELVDNLTVHPEEEITQHIKPPATVNLLMRGGTRVIATRTEDMTATVSNELLGSVQKWVKERQEWLSPYGKAYIMRTVTKTGARDTHDVTFVEVKHGLADDDWVLVAGEKFQVKDFLCAAWTHEQLAKHGKLVVDGHNYDD